VLGKSKETDMAPKLVSTRAKTLLIKKTLSAKQVDKLAGRSIDRLREGDKC
jgi:hypothetical protein